MAAGEDQQSAALAGEATPIAQLRPDLAGQATRLVRGEVTITWPYSSVNKTIAFLLAEPDVRLRRVKGLVRIQLHGPCAKAVADCVIGGGDLVTLSLNGAEWEKDTDGTPARPPGSRLEWQLKFTRRLVAEVKSSETQETKTLNIDQPADGPAGPELAAITVPTLDPEPESHTEPEIRPADQIPTRPSVEEVQPNLYSSPALLKRERVSWGGLLDEELRMFEEDGGVKGKGRKRPKNSRYSGVWRYTSVSASPSPEPDAEGEAPVAERTAETPPQSSPTPRPRMTDEGCQTIELDFSPIPVPRPVYQSLLAPPSEATSPGKPPGGAYPTVPFANMESGVQTYDAGRRSEAAVQSEPFLPANPIPSSEVATADPSHFSGFLPSNADYAMPRFQAANAETSFGGPPMSLGDQVRFGFSHKPQPVFDPMPPAGHMGHIHPPGGQGDYPESFLDHPQHGVPTFPAIGGTQIRHSPQQGSTPQHAPPAPHHMEQSSSIPLWPITSQSLDSSHVAAHIDANASTEPAGAAHLAKDNLRSNGSEPEEPEPGDLGEEAAETQERETEAEPIYRHGGEELADAAAGAEDDIDEGDEYEDDYLSGEHDEEYEAEDRIGADYDMRNYADYEDDLDGEDDREHLGLVPDAEAIDEDEDEDEDEEGSYDEDDDEADYDDTYAAPRRSALPSGPPPAKTAPVVIDLISDSEDEDEQGTPAHPASQPPIVKETANEVVGFEEGVGEEEGEDEYSEEDGEGEEFEDESEDSENEVDARYRGGTLVDRDAEGQPSRDAAAAAAAAGQDASSDVEPDTGGASAAEVFPSQEVQPEGEGESGDEHDVTVEREPSELLDEEEEELAEMLREEETAKAEGTSDTAHVTAEPASSQEGQGEEAATSEPEHGAASNVDNVTPKPEVVVTAGPQPASEPAPQTGEDAEQLGKTAGEHGDTPMREASLEARRQPEAPAQQLGRPTMDVDADPVRPAEEGDEDMADVQEVAPSVLGDQSMADADEVRSAADRDESMADAEEAPPSLDEDMASVRTVEPLADEDDDMASVRTVEPARGKDEDMADIENIEPQRGAEVLTVEALDDRREDVVMEPSSPPLTQPFESHVVERSIMISTTEEIVLVDAHDAGHLLTPLDTQASETVVRTETFVEEERETQATTEPGSTEHLREAVDVTASSGAVDAEEAALRSVEDATEQPDTGGHPVEGPTSDERREASTASTALTPPRATTSTSHQQEQEAQAAAPKHTHEHGAKASSTESAPEAAQAQPDKASAQTDPATEASAPSSPGVDRQDMTPSSRPSQSTAAAGDEAGDKDAHASIVPNLDFLPEDPSIQLARTAVAPKRGRRAAATATVTATATASAPAQDPPRKTRSAAKSQQREATPESEGDTSVQLAKAAINSPKKSRDAEASATQLKLELSKRLRTEMPDCVALKSLRSHLNKNLDLAAVVTTVPPEPQRAKGGPRQYMLSFNVTDPSIAPLHVVEVHFFRAHKDYLPAVKPGDSVLLRSFTVVALKDKGFGLRTHDGSSWAVFDREDGLAQIRGPPVELAERESAYMMDLKRWYSALGEPAKAKLERANQKFAEVNGANGANK